MRKKRIYFGISAAPPHLDHQRIVAALLQKNQYDNVSVVVTGKRQDKPEYCLPEQRLAMARLMFSTEWMNQFNTPCSLDSRDVFKANIPTIELLEREQAAYPGQDIVFVVGMDLLAPRKEYGGESEMQHAWVRGRELYEKFNFIVIPRKGFRQRSGALPDNFSIFDINLEGISSEDIRRRVQEGLPFEHLVTPEVGEYIKVHRLFRE